MAAVADVLDGNKGNDHTDDDLLLKQYMVWCRLRSQLHQYKVKLRSFEAVVNGDGSDAHVDDADTIKKRISGLNEKLLELSELNSIKLSLAHNLQLGQTTLDMLFPHEGELSSKEDCTELRDRVDVTTELVSKIQRIDQEMNELQTTLTDVKTKNAELMRSCRELMISCEKQLSEKQEDKMRRNTKDQRLARVQQTHENLIDKLDLLHNCFQGLILGSGVNWNDDAELRNIVFQLGQSIEDIIGSC